jgi:hypothetical protein
MNLSIKLEDIRDALKIGLLPPPHVVEAQKVASLGGEVVITHFGEIVAKFRDEGDLNRYFVSMADGDADIIRTDRTISQEVTNLVADMVANSPCEVNFTVGRKKAVYRQAFIDEIQNQKRILLDDQSDRIVFGYAHDKPCTVIYLESIN